MITQYNMANGKTINDVPDEHSNTDIGTEFAQLRIQTIVEATEQEKTTSIPSDLLGVDASVFVKNQA